MKTRLLLPCIVLLSLAACQNEQPATSTAPASQQTSNTATSPAASTVAVTKEVVETHAKELQAKMAEGKQVAAKAAKQLTQSVTASVETTKAAVAAKMADAAKASEDAKSTAAAKAAEAAKTTAAAKAAEAAKTTAATKAAEAAKTAAAAKAAEAAKAAAATKAAETAKAAAAAKAAEAAKVASAPMAAALTAPSPQMGAVGDAAKGKALANKCKGCHNFTAKKKVGPGLQGVVGRKVGSMAGMKYSTALAAGGWVWNEKNLTVWLCDSKKAVKTLSGNPAAKTKMGAQRICDATKQADLIAFLKTL